MPTWLIIVLAVFAPARRRRGDRGAPPARRDEDRFEADLQRVNRDLALAHAEDRGWERGTLEAPPARATPPSAAASPPTSSSSRSSTAPAPTTTTRSSGIGHERLTLGRRDGEWVLEALE